MFLRRAAVATTSSAVNRKAFLNAFAYVKQQVPLRPVLGIQRRHFSSSDINSRSVSTTSTTTAAAAVEDGEKREAKLVYEAPLARAVRTMKGVSIASCTLTIFGMPTVLVMSNNGAPLVGQIAMAGTVMLFGIGTTSLFHILFRPYITRMSILEGEKDPLVQVETYSLFARVKPSSFRLSDVRSHRKTMHPMVSFEANDKSYFIHPECIEDKALLKKLMCK